MRLVLEKRPERSRAMQVASPLFAVALTILFGSILFAARGIDPLHAIYVYFVGPLTTLWSVEELIVKATPLVLIGAGLAICFRADLWNIGAEGQFIAGAPGRRLRPHPGAPVGLGSGDPRDAAVGHARRHGLGSRCRRCYATASAPTRSLPA